jgi:hypothetical protein
VELEHLKPDRAMSLPREGSLAGQKLRPCQKAGWHGSGCEGMRLIGMLLSIDSTGCGNVMVNGRKHRAVEKTCQYHKLDGS